MKSLGAFLVASCAVVVAACSGDSFQPGASGGTGGGAAAAGIAGASGDSSGRAGEGGGAGQATGGTAGGGGLGGAGGADSGSSGSSAVGGGGSGGIGGALPQGGVGGIAGEAGTGGGGQTGGSGGNAGAPGGAGAGGEAGAGPTTLPPAFSPSNGKTAGVFAEPTGATYVVTGATFDTGSQCLPTTQFSKCRVAAPQGTQPVEVCVCTVDGSIALTGVSIVGERPLLLLVSGDLTIDGTIRILAGQSLPNPQPNDDAPRAGGTFATLGGGAKGPPLGSETLEPLTSGQEGQRAGLALGGRAGGTLQLSVRGTLTIKSTAILDAGGEGGAISEKNGPGPGGGSGGGLLLEANSLVLQGAVLANGGSGSGGGSKEVTGKPGTKGSTTAEPAPGGDAGGDSCNAGATKVVGGKGGRGAAIGGAADPGGPAKSQACAIGNISASAGGGGGGVGRVRLRARTFTVEGTVSPAASQQTIDLNEKRPLAGARSLSSLLLSVHG